MPPTTSSGAALPTAVATPRVLVLGDLHFDDVEVPVRHAGDKCHRWETESALYHFCVCGGAWLLEQILLEALPAPGIDLVGVDASTPYVDNELTALDPLVQSKLTHLPGPHPHARDMVLRSLCTCRLVSQFSTPASKDKVYRLGHVLGWRHHVPHDPALRRQHNRALHEAHCAYRLDLLRQKPGPLDLLVLCDKNHGFRGIDLGAVLQLQPRACLVQMNSPLTIAEGLWKQLDAHKLLDRTLLVINASCLREAHVQITFNGSVEQSTADFVLSLRQNTLLRELSRCAHLIVRFKHGSIHYQCRRRLVTGVYTEYADYEITGEDQGEMVGHTTLVAVAVAEGWLRAVAGGQTTEEGIALGLRKGTVLSEWHFWDGFGRADFLEDRRFHAPLQKPIPYDALLEQYRIRQDQWEKRYNKKGKELVGGGAAPSHAAVATATARKFLALPERNFPKNAFALAEVCVHVPERNIDSWSRGWSRIGEFLKAREQQEHAIAQARQQAGEEGLPLTRRQLAENYAVRIVKEGLAAVFGDTREASDSIFHAPRAVAVNRFGKIETIDRHEIEQYTSLQNVLTKYLTDRGWKEPLSIAVFGPPGSGKSYAVKQVLASIQDGKPREPLEFNLTQFTHLNDLAEAFHQVQDRGLASAALSDEVPLVFFDEFDSTFENRPLGLLKYFLDPMQNGNFKDRGTVYNIGKAIFVFAGGVAHNFHQFRKWQDRGVDFAAAKGPDFISRLRGHLDVGGPNPTADRGEHAEIALLFRRAVLLRALIFKRMKAIVDDATQIANIDDDVVRAFLNVRTFEHGTRSMEAIIQMSSSLREGGGFHKSYLPSPDQLAMHVDASAFRRLVDGLSMQ